VRVNRRGETIAKKGRGIGTLKKYIGRIMSILLDCFLMRGALREMVIERDACQLRIYRRVNSLLRLRNPLTPQISIHSLPQRKLPGVLK